LIFDDEFMRKAMIRIDELQQETIDKAKAIDGAEEYIAKKIELYEKDEELRKNAKAIQIEEAKLADEFFQAS